MKDLRGSYCGGCIRFRYEDIDGYGYCKLDDMIRNCGDDACHGYIGDED